jgi:hypothetical protein
LPKGQWRVTGSLVEKSSALQLTAGELRWQPKGEWTAAVVLLKR